MRPEITCPTCKGSRFDQTSPGVWDPMTPCPDCQGHGVVPDPRPKLYGTFIGIPCGLLPDEQEAAIAQAKLCCIDACAAMMKQIGAESFSVELIVKDGSGYMQTGEPDWLEAVPIACTVGWKACVPSVRDREEELRAELARQTKRADGLQADIDAIADCLAGRGEVQDINSL